MGNYMIVHIMLSFERLCMVTSKDILNLLDELNRAKQKNQRMYKRTVCYSKPRVELWQKLQYIALPDAFPFFVRVTLSNIIDL